MSQICLLLGRLTSDHTQEGLAPLLPVRRNFGQTIPKKGFISLSQGK
jgi:hypothetical protein